MLDLPWCNSAAFCVSWIPFLSNYPDADHCRLERLAGMCSVIPAYMIGLSLSQPVICIVLHAARSYGIDPPHCIMSGTYLAWYPGFQARHSKPRNGNQCIGVCTTRLQAKSCNNSSILESSSHQPTVRTRAWPMGQGDGIKMWCRRIQQWHWGMAPTWSKKEPNGTSVKALMSFGTTHQGSVHGTGTWGKCGQGLNCGTRASDVAGSLKDNDHHSQGHR